MNKAAIKNFAIWARVQLIEAAKQRAYEYEITEDGENKYDLETIGGRVLSKEEKEQRKQLIEQIRQKGYAQVMEEAAYTWFNRFIALRFMEVNGYLPSKIRVFTDETGAFKPEILKEAMSVELEGLNRSKVLDLIDKQNNEELYKYLLITQCNALNGGLPYMFEKIANWTELLFPANLLRNDSVIGHMVTDIPEEDWTDQVQIIGWLYQYYNEERKNEVINIYKGMIKKEDIPPATQLFTTDWVVRYIIDNSLGRYWIERNPSSGLKEKLEFLIVPKSGEFTFVDEKVKPEDIGVFDPCMGSAHFLVYAFEVLMDIYTERGWSERDAAKNILENNLYGLDIDNRAGQLAYFAVMMKARSYNRRILNENIDLHIMAMETSEFLTEGIIDYVAADNSQLTEILTYIRTVFADAKECGSMLDIQPLNYDVLMDRIHQLETKFPENLLDQLKHNVAVEKLPALIKQAKILTKKYEIVVTNPPYLNKMNANLKKFVNDNYKEYSGDLFSVFMYRNFGFCKENGYSGFMTPFVWMFIKTYENLRNYIIEQKSIATLVQMEYSAFEEATVPICSFVLKNGKDDECGLYFKLSDFKGGMEVQKEKVLEAIADKDCGYYYESQQANFVKIPGSSVAYWVSDSMMKAFSGRELADYGKTRQGFATGDNDRFLRQWTEINFSNLLRGCTSSEDFWAHGGKYAPCNKGGKSRKWYGNNFIVCKYDKASYDALLSMGNHLPSREYYYRSGLTWSTLSSGFLSMRYSEPGYLFETKGSMYFADDETDHLYLLGLMNSKVAMQALQVLCPTIDFHEGPVSHVPVIMSGKEEVEPIVKSNIEISKNDWDSYETSWDFKRHPLV